MFATRALQRTLLKHTSAFSIAIVGSGPSGCYAAAAAAKTFPNSSIDVLEALPTPFGLVRYGIAPDHGHAKVVANQFGQTIGQQDLTLDGRNRAQVCWLGNVEVGKAVTLDELQGIYRIVILAAGAARERNLDHLQKSELTEPKRSGGAGAQVLSDMPSSVSKRIGAPRVRVLSAREIVSWYNGHPLASSRVPRDLIESCGERVVVIGNGNVALDVARIFLKDPKQLEDTDIAPDALRQLRESRIREIVLVGRRGPAQAKWTAKELREVLTKLSGVSCHADSAEMVLSTVDKEELGIASNRSARRCYDILREATERACSVSGNKTLSFRFLLTPHAINNAGIQFKRSVLRGPAMQQRAEVSSEEENDALSIDTQLVTHSIGYSVDLASVGAFGGLELDGRTGAVANKAGRVMERKDLYVTGWMKRGPSGIVGTNKWCADETVRTIESDVKEGLFDVPEKVCDTQLGFDRRSELLALLTERQVPVVDWNAWLRIDAAERRAGAELNRPRVKFTTVGELLDAAFQQG